MTASPLLSPCGLMTKQHDYYRYLCILFAPVKDREALFALCAFNSELAKIVDTVSEPMLGSIRLQWWREAIDDAYEGKFRKHEVIEALAPFIESQLVQKSSLLSMIDTREGELEFEVPENIEALEVYAAKTSSELNDAMLQLLGIESEMPKAIAHHMGVAWGLVGLLRATRHALEHQRYYFPQTLLDRLVLEEEDLVDEDKISPIVKDILLRAEWHLNQAKLRWNKQEKKMVPILLLAVILRNHMQLIHKKHYRVLSTNFNEIRPLLPLKLLIKQLFRRYF